MGSRRPHGHARRFVITALAALLVTTVFAVVEVGGAAAPSGGSAAASALCPSDGSTGCIEKLPCNTGQCPQADVSPLEDVESGQYVYVRATNFPSGDSIRVAVCSTSESESPDSSDPECLVGDWESQFWTPTQVAVAVDSSNDNLTEISVPVFADASGGGASPLPSRDLLGAKGAGKGFFCDNADDPCAVEVTLEQGVGNGVGNGPPVSASNTMTFPISFVAANGGCPASDPTVQTDSSFSLEHFLPDAVDATCGGSNGVVALNTTDDNQSVVSDFTSGGTSLVFLDQPSDPDVLAQLSGQSYAWIPIAVSATAVGFLAGQIEDGVAFPLSTYNLTPNMVAGLITSQYETPDGAPVTKGNSEVPGYSDNLIPPLSCSNLVGCPIKGANHYLQVYNELTYNTFSLLNPLPSGDLGPGDFGSFMSNVSTGASYQVTNWLCNAPNAPISVQVNEITPPSGETNPVTVTLTDPNVASTTLTSAPAGSTIWPPYTSASQPDGPPWVYPTCQGYSTFPPLASEENDYAEASNPSFQAKDIRSYAYDGASVPPYSVTPYAGFGVMDSSEANYYGLNMASVQNADGDFVVPTETSIEAGASAMTACSTDDTDCPAGTFDLSYASASAKDAYPLPDVTYALVSTAAQPAATATAIKDLLTNLVDYSHSSGSVLPSGYAPLPTAMYQAALSDISKDIVSEPVSTSSKTPSSSGTSSGSTVANASGFPSPSSSTGSGEPILPYGSTSTTTTTTSPAKSSSSSSPGSGSGGSTAAQSHGFLLLSLDASRFLLPVLIVVALACLVAGPLLLFGPVYRRRRRSRNGAGASPP